MLIGELAGAVGLTPQTIRFYERKGLLPPASRTANGYRSYDDAAVARLRFIRAGQAAGLTLVQLRGIVDLRDHGQAPCSHVARLVEDELLDVHRRIGELTRLQTELEDLRERARRLDPADCTDAEICQILTAQHETGHPRPEQQPVPSRRAAVGTASLTQCRPAADAFGAEPQSAHRRRLARGRSLTRQSGK